uniref:Secreted protein n=1 Tax=Syphacia muris TaxID=451379 RepID=A0A0N5ATP9_9BILA
MLYKRPANLILSFQRWLGKGRSEQLNNCTADCQRKPVKSSRVSCAWGRMATHPPRFLQFDLTRECAAQFVLWKRFCNKCYISDRQT